MFLATHAGRDFDEWPLKSWDFESLTLAAFYYHPSLDLARAQRGVTAAGIQTAKGRPNPTASVGPGYNFNAANAVSPWIANFTLDLPIETAGKRGQRTARAEYLSEAARLNIATAAWQVRANLRTALIQETSAAQRHNLLEQQLEAQQAIAQVLEQRFLAGAISVAEVNVARIAVVRLRAELADSLRLLAENLGRLAEAIGVPRKAIEGIEFNSPLPLATNAPLASSVLRRQALQSRADVLSALAAYEASQATLRLEIARQYPDIHLGNGYQWDQGENKWSVGLTFELPVLNRNQGPIREAEAKRKEAAAQVLAVQAKIIGEIDHSSGTRSAIAEQLLQLRRLNDELRDQLSLLESRFAAGGADLLEVQTAKLELSIGALAILDAEVKSMQTAGQLEDALQAPLKAIAAAEQDRELPAKKVKE